MICILKIIALESWMFDVSFSFVCPIWDSHNTVQIVSKNMRGTETSIELLTQILTCALYLRLLCTLCSVKNAHNNSNSGQYKIHANSVIYIYIDGADYHTMFPFT